MLRHRLDIYTAPSASTFDAYGQVTTTRTTVLQVSGAIEPLRGTEGLLTRQLYPTVTHKVTIRYSTELVNVKPDHHIMFGSRKLSIAEILHKDERNFELELLCVEERR